MNNIKSLGVAKKRETMVLSWSVSEIVSMDGRELGRSRPTRLIAAWARRGGICKHRPWGHVYII